MGSIAIPWLEEFRLRRMPGGSSEDRPGTWVLDNVLLSGLELGIQETLRYLGTRPSREEFEAWILERNGGSIEPWRIDRINRAIAGEELRDATPEPIFTPEEMAFWDEHGYVVLHDAVTPAEARAATAAIFAFLGADPATPDTWYSNPQGHSIWIHLLRHPALVATRRSPRIYRAFAQLWGRGDLWPTIDQAGLNPPERPGWPFPGPRLHWDTSLHLPIPFGTQGILYLTDTAAEQGAFTCVPGFHRRIEEWIQGLPDGADPRAQNLDALATPIAGRAGDLIIWHHALPHGARPNRAAVPRVVQYVNQRPTRWVEPTNWK